MWVRGRGDVDVTADATWSVSAQPFSLSPTTIATLSSPGVIAPLRVGDIYVRVDYLEMYSVAPHSYAVNPTVPALPLAPYLTGSVFEVEGFTPVPSVLLEIIDGEYNIGKTDETRTNGAYFINHIRMGIPFKVRASKPGYVPSVESHPGITDDQLGFPSNNYLHFRLARIPAT